jgi:hypothetical protein
MLLTRAEATKYHETSRHADVMAFIAALAARNDKRLHVTGFGFSPQGRELPLLVLSARGVRTPAEARAAGLPVVLVLDGIHPGEVEGKEASLALVRDMLGAGAGGANGAHADVLERITLLVAPLFNPDGNDALDPANRRLDLPHLAGQPGPVVGTRTQSHGINLNRDYLRQAAPEMRLLQAGVCQPWAPDLSIDNHATNGSVHRFHMTVDIPHTVASGRREPIEFMRTRVVPDVMRAVEAHGFDSGWYGNFVEDERVLDANGEVDPTSAVGLGWMTYPHHPRFGSNYRGLTNRLDILLECYSYLSFEERVATARAWQVELLRWAAAHGDDIRNVVAASQRPPDEIAVRYALEDFPSPVEILTRTPRTLGGAPSSLHLPHRARFVGTTVVTRPRAYAVPAPAAAHLARHGLRIEPAPAGPVAAVIARIEAIGTDAGRHILDAATVGDLTVSWRDEQRALPPGYALVPTDQPLGAIAVYLCEPESDDGAVENGLVTAPTAGDDFPIWRVR